MKRSAVVACLLLALLSPPARADDRALHLAIGDPARRDREVSVVLDAVTDAARGDTIGPAELAARLDGVKLLFVGESHTEMEFHRAQLKVLQELQKRGRTVMVGLEMYPVPEQPWLDRWFSDRRMTEERFLAESRWYKNWGYNWNYYRDIFLFARENRVRMFAVNLPRGVVGTVRSKGFDSLTTEQRTMLPPKVDVDDPEHQKLFRAFFGDEDALHGNMPDDMFRGMFRAQCAWDAAMGWNAVKALQKYGDEKAIMVVLIGSGHVAYGLGAERQVKPWFPGRVASVLPLPIADAPGEKPVGRVQASYANFLWGLPPQTDPIYPSTGISSPETKTGAHYKVIAVGEESPAGLAGIAVGDELVSMDGIEITDKEVTNRHLSTKRWGDTVVYRVLRGGKEMTIPVALRRRPHVAGAADSTAAPATPAHPAMPPGSAPKPPGMPPGAAPSHPGMPPKGAGGGGK